MMRDWKRWLLLASLALNLLVIAMVVAALLSGDRDRDRRRGGGPPEIAALSRGLDDETRRQMFDRLRADPGLRGGRGRMEDARAAVGAALRADPFDREAFAQAMSRQSALQVELAGRGISVLADVIGDLSQAERIALAERLDAVGRRR